MVDVNNYLEDFSKCFDNSSRSLEYYDKAIEELKTAIYKIKYEIKKTESTQEKIERYESELESLKTQRIEAKAALEKIKEKANSFIETSKLSLDRDLRQELDNFFQNEEYRKERKKYYNENKKADQELNRSREDFTNVLDKNGKKVKIAKASSKVITLGDYKELRPNPSQGIEYGVDAIADRVNKAKNISQKEEKEETKEENLSSKSRRIEILIENADLSYEEEDNLKVVEIRYKEIEKRKRRIEQASSLIEKLNGNQKYKKTVQALGRIQEYEQKQISKIEKEISKIEKVNIDELYEIYVKEKELERKKIIEEQELERMEESDNKFAEDRIEVQKGRLDNVYMERNDLEEKEKELRGISETQKMQSPPEEKSIVELENEINQKLRDNSGLGIQSTRFYQQYAVEKVKGSELGSGSFSEYLESAVPGNIELIELQNKREERDRLIFEEYEENIDHLGNMTYEEYAFKKYGIEGAERPVIKSDSKTR